MIGLGTAGYISTAVTTLPGGLVSTANLANLLSTSYLTTQLGSTVIGLGTAGYFSTIPRLIQTQLISTGTIFTSSVMLIDTTIGGAYAGFANQLIVSAGILLLNNNSLSGGGGGSGAVTQIVGGTNITISPPGGTGVVTINAASFPNLGGYISTANLTNYVSTANLANLVSTSYLASQLASTVIGLGTAGYISSVPNVSIGGVVSTANLANLVSTSYLATQLTSTVIGLGTAGYVSTSQLTSTTQGTFSYISSFVSTYTQTVPGSYSGEQLYLNYSIPVGNNYELGIQNINGGPGTTFTSTIRRNTVDDQLDGFETDFTLPSFFGTGLWSVTIFAQSADSGLTLYASLFIKSSLGVLTLIGTSSQSPFIVQNTKVSLDLVIDVPYTDIPAGSTLLIRLYCANTTSNKDILLTLYFEGGNYSHVHTTLGITIPQAQITSSLIGLGSMGYLSTIQWGSVVSTANLARLVSTANLANLVSTANLGSLISTANLASLISTANLANLVSTANLANLVSTANLASLISTANLIDLISTANLASLTSTPNLVNLISTANLANIVSTSYLLNGIEFSSLSNETARMNFSSLFVNNVPILFDQYGNLSLSFQTL